LFTGYDQGGVAGRLADIVRISTLIDARSFFWNCRPSDATDDRRNESETDILKTVCYVYHLFGSYNFKEKHNFKLEESNYYSAKRNLVNLPGGRRLWSSSTTAPLDIHRQDKTTGSPALSPGSARHSISSRLPNLTRRVNSVTLTPPPENVNIFITQGRKHFDFYLLVVAGNSFPVRRILVPHLIGDAFSVEWQPKLFFNFS
jgi:hypothetical protein